jgi:hypothetical protein
MDSKGRGYLLAGMIWVALTRPIPWAGRNESQWKYRWSLAQRLNCLQLLAAFGLADRRLGGSVHLLGILGQGSHMFQVRNDLLIIGIGIVKAKMLCNTNSRYPKKITHRV